VIGDGSRRAAFQRRAQIGRRVSPSTSMYTVSGVTIARLFRQPTRNSVA
jgi:hypothetical protein